MSKVVLVLLRGGERLSDAPLSVPPGDECVDLVASESVAHVRFARSGR